MKRYQVEKGEVNCPLCGRVLWCPMVEDGTRYCGSCDEVFYMQKSVINHRGEAELMIRKPEIHHTSEFTQKGEVTA